MADITETSKLTVKQLGNPMRAAVDNRNVVLGTIIGRATGTKVKLDSKGDAHEAIVGTFEGKSADGNITIHAAMLYLPGGLHESIVERLKEMKGAPAEFGVEIMSMPATNAAGYSYAMRSLMPMTATSDPLAAIRAAAGLAPQVAIAGPETVNPEIGEVKTEAATAVAADTKKK